MDLNINVGPPQPLSDRPATKKPKPAATWVKRFQHLLLMGFVVLAIVLFLVWLSDPSRDPTAGAARNRPVTIGSEAILRIAKSEAQPDHFPLTKSFEDHEELTKAAVAGDKVGLAELFVSGRAINVPSGTKVFVLETYVLTCKVRILEGKHAGQSAWVGGDYLSGIGQ